MPGYPDKPDFQAMGSATIADLSGPFGAFERPLRFPMYIGFLWYFCMGARGA